MDLNESRAVINEIDEQLVALFKKRMETVVEVARYKKNTGLPVLDCSREQVVLDHVAAMAGDELGDYARALYECLMGLSRDYQAKLMDEGRL